MRSIYLVLLSIISIGYCATPFVMVVDYTISGGIIQDADGGDILYPYLNGVLLSTENGLVNDDFSCIFNSMFCVQLTAGFEPSMEALLQLQAGGELTFTLESINDGVDEELQMVNEPFIVEPGSGHQIIELGQVHFISENSIVDACEDLNYDGIINILDVMILVNLILEY